MRALRPSFEVQPRAGTPGADAVPGDTQLYAIDALTWPGNGASATFDVGFSTATSQGLAPQAASFVGEILETDGRYVQPGARVEAYIGTTRCGTASTRRIGSFSGCSGRSRSAASLTALNSV